jgi:hypothetical protein
LLRSLKEWQLAVASVQRNGGLRALFWDMLKRCTAKYQLAVLAPLMGTFLSVHQTLLMQKSMRRIARSSKTAAAIAAAPLSAARLLRGTAGHCSVLQLEARIG